MVSEQQGLRDLLLSLDSGSAATTSNSLSSFIRVLAHTQPTGAVASDSAASSIVSCVFNLHASHLLYVLSD